MASTGNFPIEVSALKQMQSAPSNTALVASYHNIFISILKILFKLNK